MRYHFNKNIKDGFELETPGPNQPVAYRKVMATPKKIAGLKEYCGTYMTDEIDYSFMISLKNGKLVLTNHRHGTTDIVLYGRDDLYPGFYFIDHLVVIRNKKRQIMGLELTRGDTAGLSFYKQFNK